LSKKIKSSSDHNPVLFRNAVQSLEASTIKDYPVWTKYAARAFLQRKDTFSRDLYARLLLELRVVFEGYVLKILKHLYSTKEAGTCWNAAYSEDWKQKVGVFSSTLDPSFMTGGFQTLDSVAEENWVVIR
jgi:hypothetical protein